MCSSRFVEPPNAAWTAIALRTAASVRMSRVVSPRAASSTQRRGPSGGPCRARSAGRTARAPSAAATARAPRRRPATWPRCRGTGSRRRACAGAAAELGGLLQRELAVGEAGADRSAPCRRPRRRCGGSVTPPGTSTHGRSRMRGQGHHHRGQALVAGGDAEHALAAWAASGSAGGRRWPRRCGRAGCPSCRACPACGRRTGRSSKPANGQRRRAPSAPRPPPARAGRPPSGRCDSRARWACRRRRGCRPAC